MPKAFLIAFLLGGCAPNPQNACGMQPRGDYFDRFAGSYLTTGALQEAVWWVLQARTSDPRLADPRENCDRLARYSVLTTQTVDAFPKRAGICDCPLGVIVVGTPVDRRWQSSALAHELFHALQSCSSLLPIGPGQDLDHANWDRDGVESAVAWVRAQPTGI